MEVQLLGAQAAQVFTSVEVIALLEQLEEKPVLTYTYQATHSGEAAVTKELKLPNPSIDYLESFLDLNGNEKVGVSTIVYV